MTNALIVTPATFKQQLIWRMCFLLTHQPANTFFLGDAGVEVFGGVTPTTLFSKKGKELFIEWVDADGNTATSSADEFYIEDLWQMYMACEPLYQQRIALDYTNIEG